MRSASRVRASGSSAPIGLPVEGPGLRDPGRGAADELFVEPAGGDRGVLAQDGVAGGLHRGLERLPLLPAGPQRLDPLPEPAREAAEGRVEQPAGEDRRRQLHHRRSSRGLARPHPRRPQGDPQAVTTPSPPPVAGGGPWH